MRLFTCQACGQTLFFENARCERCGRRLGFLPGAGAMSALEPSGEAWVALAEPGRLFRPCANAAFGACNWMIAAEGEGAFCRCCAHNRTIPDLSDVGRLGQWRRIEEAKRRLFYTLLQLGLPTPTLAGGDGDPLVFDFLADPPSGHRVLTGHENGLITIALAEADDAERERVRTAMGEPYRTLLGHFRHEIGHYYWDRLIAGRPAREEFVTLFGDPAVPYGEALARYYASGPASDWNTSFVSAYASLHPWEDWAESWAHYFHIIDTLEMARSLGLGLTGPLGSAPATPAAPAPFASVPVAVLLADWLPLAVAVNSLNRCMGQPDFYPFVLPGPVVGKIDFIHRIVSGGVSGPAS